MTQPCPGPILATKPRLKAPRGACDTHAHILGPYDRFPLNENRSYTAPEAPLEDFLVLLASLGLERAVIVHGSAHGIQLDVTEDAIIRMEGRARGVAVVEPDAHQDRAADDVADPARAREAGGRRQPAQGHAHICFQEFSEMSRQI